MLTWETIAGGIVGLVFTLGGLGVVVWGALAAADWAKQDMTPGDPALDDEDEIDHRFY